MLYDHTWLEAAEEKAGVVPAGDIMTIREMTVGPWLACGEEDARKLIETLALKSTGDPLRVGILESNSRAVGLARSFESLRERTPCWRMVRGDGEGLGHHPDLYGIGSAAKG